MTTINQRSFSLDSQKLSLVIVSIFVLMNGINALQNIAVNKVAYQSSTYGNAAANLAIDGNKDTRYDSGSCSRTANRMDSWLIVDLLDQYIILGVELTNRGDYYAYRLRNFIIEVSQTDPRNMFGFPQRVGEVCAVQKDQVAQGESEQIICNRFITGRYIRIYKPRYEDLAVCELEVYGVKAQKPDKPSSNSTLRTCTDLDGQSGQCALRQVLTTGSQVLQNVALKKMAYQSSTFYDGYAANAVDGIKDNNYTRNRCQHTDEYTDSWLMVDLEDEYNIFGVELTNRGDCCGYRLQKFTIEVSQKDPRKMSGFPQIVGEICAFRKDQVALGRTEQIICNRVLTGRYVRIFKPANEYLTVCELEVYGTKAEPDCYNECFDLSDVSVKCLMESNCLVITDDVERENCLNTCWRSATICINTCFIRCLWSCLDDPDCPQDCYEEKISKVEPYVMLTNKLLL